MKARSLLAVLLLGSWAAHAQQCINNLDAAGNVCTSFTLGPPTSNCIPVLTQDGQAVPQFSGAVCPNGFFGGSSLQIQLPSDPVDPGNALVSYICSTTELSNTVPGVSFTAPQPAGSYVQSLTCTIEYNWYTATWSGTLTYDYASVHQRRCSSGRGGYCRTGWFPVETGGSGEIATAPPPPPPPPPPQPTVIDVTLVASACDASWTCALKPADASAITGGVFAPYAMTLQVNNGDGSVDTYALDSANVVLTNDDGTAAMAFGSGSIFDADGNVVKSISITTNVSIDEDTALPSITGGTLEITIPPQ
jgi:hypothetical protein